MPFNRLDEPPVEVTLRVPLPPDCPFDIAGDALQCRIVFPAAYPAEACTVSVLNEDIPQRLRRKIDAAVQKRGATAYKENPAMASGLLRWMRNNVDTLLVDKLITDEYVTGIKLDVFDSTKTKSYVIEDDPSLFQHAMVKLPQTRGSGSIDGSEREQPQPQPQQKGPANEEKAEEEGGSGSGATEQDAESEGESGSDADGSAGAEPSRNGGGKPQTMYPTTTAHRGTQLVLPSLKMEGIGIMKCSQLEVIFLCGRCQYQGVASLVPDKVTQCTFFFLSFFHCTHMCVCVFPCIKSYFVVGA